LAKRYARRTGGYVRLVHLGPRFGDAAEMAQLELVE
jgi:ribosomal protein L17